MPSFTYTYPTSPNQYKLTLNITQGAGNVNTNSTPVSWSLQLTTPGNNYFEATATYSAVINGVTVVSKNEQVNTYAVSTTYTLASGTTTVAHNTDGTKTIAVSASFKTNDQSSYWRVPPLSVSGNVTLTTIPRYTTVTNPSISSITRNSYKFSFSTGNTIDRWEYSSNGGAWTLGQTGDRTSGTGTLSGFGANTKPTIRVRVRRKDSQLWTASSTVTVTLEATASPNTPTISEVTRNSFKINVTANKSFNGFQYNINGGAWSARQSGTSVTVSGRAASTTYQVRVRVYDGVHTSLLSGQSSAVNAVTLSAASPNRPTLVSRTATSITFNWSSNRTVTNVEYKRWRDDPWQSTGSDFSARTSGTITTTDLTPGTERVISVRVKDAVHGTWSSESAGLTVTNYDLSTVTGSNTTVDTGQKSFTLNKAAPTFWHKVTLQMLDNHQQWIDLREFEGTEGGGFTLSSALITQIQNNSPNSNTLSVRYECETRLGSAGGTVQGTTHSPEYIWTLVNVNPTLSSITYRDTHSDSTFVAWKGGNQKILRNVSPVRATLGTATAIKGATLSRYVFNINGQSFTVNATSGAKTQTGAIRNLGVINSATNVSLKVTVYDSRNNSTSKSVTVSMLDYIPPQVLTIEAQRENNYEAPTTLVVSGRSYIVKNAAGTNVNTYTAKYRMKKSSASTWPSYINVTATKGTTSGSWQNYSINRYMGAFDTETPYDIEFVFQDSVGTEYTQKIVLTKGIGLMTFLADKVELGVPLYDKNSEKRYLLEGEGGLTSVSWSEVSSKPTTATRWPTWSEVTSKPSTFAPSAHTHTLPQVINFNNAGAHNSIYRGQYLGSSVTTAQYNAISSGTFTDLYIGDYWTIGGIDWRIAAFNYYYNTGDTALTTNHVVIVPDQVLYSYQMNTSGTTTGGYTGSRMYTNGLASAKTTINNAFYNHVVSVRAYFSNAATSGQASGGAWFNSTVDLMNEVMVYGSLVRAAATNQLFNVGTDTSQLPLFALYPQSMTIRQSWWLRDVVEAAHFAYVGHAGTVNSGNAHSTGIGVRPRFLIS